MHALNSWYVFSRYLAPELNMTGRSSTKSDMYSFGFILIEMVTGRGIYYDWCHEIKSQNGLSYVSTSVTNRRDLSETFSFFAT